MQTEFVCFCRELFVRVPDSFIIPPFVIIVNTLWKNMGMKNGVKICPFGHTTVFDVKILSNTLVCGKGKVCKAHTTVFSSEG